MKLLRGAVEVLPGAKSLSLDEVFALAQQEGRVEIGGMRGSHEATIKLEGVDPHYLSVRSHKYPTAVQNLSECITLAKRLKAALI